MRQLLAGLALGLVLGAGVAWTLRPPPAPVQGPPAPPPNGACPPQVYLFLNGQFFRMLPGPGGEPQELFPVEPAPNPFGGS